MQKASRRPPSSTPRTPDEKKDEEEENLKISDSTRMMWDMDELKYTTFLAPKATEQTKMAEEEDTNRGEEVSFKKDEKEEVTSSSSTTTTEKPLPGGMSKDEWNQKKEEFEAYTPSILSSDLQPSHSGKSSHIPSTSPSPPPSFHFNPPSSEAPYYVEVNDADTETIYVKDVTPMFRNAFVGQMETTTRPYDPLHLEMEIAKLKESSTCLARMAFDVWCLFVLFSSVPFIMGICVPRWSLFVLHIVFDFLFLVVGFVSSLTIAIMSSIMYFLIDEMSSDSLFEFLLVAFVIDIVLILYSVIVGIAYRCCCRLVDNSIKETSINYSVSSNGEPV
uniref:MARVEL domain-containing protein n=1 Tax=Caenorhabditis tropicalis TaxID=1561998 RepID=A0A1I7URJ1_9PELO